MTRRLLLKFSSLCAVGVALGLKPFRSGGVARVDDGEWHSIVKTWDHEAGEVRVFVDGREVDRVIGLEDAEREVGRIVDPFVAKCEPQGTLAWRYRKHPEEDRLQHVSVWERQMAPADLPTCVRGGEVDLAAWIGLEEWRAVT